MSNQTLNDKNSHEHTPEEAALMMRLRIFVATRWAAIAGVIVVTLVASLVLDINFPTLPIYITCVVIALYNLLLLGQVRRLEAKRVGSVIETARRFGNIQVFLDLVALTVLLHFAGGIENPFIFFFAFHSIIASMVLHFWWAYILASTALLMVALLVGLEYAGALSHVNLQGFADPTLYKQGSYILAVLLALAAILFFSTYMVTSIIGQLRKRQRQVVQLREELLEERTGQLEQASREIAKLEEERKRFLRFIGIAAHDLKAPLTAIQGFLWVMLGGFTGQLTEKQRNMMERSSLRIKELLTLISDLLDIPRIETGQIVPEMKEFSLGEVIEHASDDMGNMAKEKGIELKMEIPESLPRVYGSAPRLQQVITNLLDNAIRYTHEGTVTIRVKEDENDIQVEVIDTGIGIPPGDLPWIFEDFFRASNVETKGTGLGLSISKRIVEAHRGRIWVESPCPETSKGTKFTFTLPKKKGEAERQPRSAKQQQSHRRLWETERLRVLPRLKHRS